MAASGAKREEKGRNIQVVVRCRPFNTTERKSSYGVIDCDTNRRELMVKTSGVNDKASRKTYAFDMVFGPAAKQIDVYRSVVCPILDEVILGYNCTVFAYGQTGTGKTFTMEGERSLDEQFTWEEDPLAGIIPRTLHQIFEKLSENGTEFSVKVSLLEIYNEELFDLLSPSDDISERLQLFDDPRNKRGVVVKGLEEVTVHNKDEVYQILERGAAKRRTASTLMNAYSSRSHSVFSVTIHMKEITVEGEELLKIGKLNLVDLAGSENIGRSGAVDKRAREAGNINQSLLTLGRVITALVEKRPHIPYRESKLTRILQDSLGGRTKTSIIATVSPSSSNLEETLSTLEYASRAKNIMNKPEVNQKLTKRTLIKEYTEEIERLKRDLAATRDKNGVYLSTENYKTMVGQISSHDENVAEMTDKIALMEEELRRMTELFTDSRSRLDQFSLDLTEKQQRLEEMNQNLQQTKEKLIQEEFISTELASAQEHLIATAGQLLSAADTGSTDVSRLHDKLDRKMKVDQFNRGVQQNFVERMDGAFNSMQRCLQQQESQQRSLLSSYSEAVDGLLITNEVALKGAMSGVESFVGGVSQLVAQSVGRWKERMEQQQVGSVQDRDGIIQTLEEHWRDMEEVLVEHTLTGLSAIQELSSSLRATAHTQRLLAHKVEAMKEETGVFFSSLVQDVAELREAAVLELQSLQAQQEKLEEDMRTAQERHQTGMQRAIRSLQDQLGLLTMEAQNDFSHLRSASKFMQEPVQMLQETMRGGCVGVEDRVSAQAALLSSASSSLASSLHLATDEGLQSLEKLTGHCSHIHSAVSGLAERGLQWRSRSREQVAAQVQAHLSFMETQSSDIQSLQQSVETLCREQVGAVGTELSGKQLKVKDAVSAVQDHISQDRTALDQQRAELLVQMELNQRLVHSVLLEELQQDVPTGTTPQRRELVYPRELMKVQSRCELLESLQKQQKALQAALQEEEEQQEEEEEQNEDKRSLVELDSPVDELSPGCESASTEPSFADQNLVCNETKRIPFFKQKRGGKEPKIPARSKVMEAEAAASPHKSRFPLRCQN